MEENGMIFLYKIMEIRNKWLSLISNSCNIPGCFVLYVSGVVRHMYVKHEWHYIFLEWKVAIGTLIQDLSWNFGTWAELDFWISQILALGLHLLKI
jgi:hypothetical protein